MNGGTLKRALRKLRKICGIQEKCRTCPFYKGYPNGCTAHIVPFSSNANIEEFIEALKVALSYDLSNDVQNKPK